MSAAAQHADEDVVGVHVRRHAVAKHGVEEAPSGGERRVGEREEDGVVGEHRGGVPGRPGERKRRGSEGGAGRERGIGLDERVEGARWRGREEAERAEEADEERQRREGRDEARSRGEREREVAAAERERKRRQARGRVEESREVRVVDRVLATTRLRRRLPRGGGGVAGCHTLQAATGRRSDSGGGAGAPRARRVTA